MRGRSWPQTGEGGLQHEGAEVSRRGRLSLGFPSLSCSSRWVGFSPGHLVIPMAGLRGPQDR